MLMVRVLRNSEFKARIARLSETSWGVLILQQGWFKQWKFVFILQLEVVEDGFLLVHALPYQADNIFEAHAFRNTVSTESLYQEHIERELDKVDQHLNEQLDRQFKENHQHSARIRTEH